MSDRPVYTIAQVSVFTDLGTSLGMTFAADEEGTVIFWDRHDVAFHAAAERNETGDGWWLVVPRMLSGIREVGN
ncbi:MAG: hypothetical protein AAF346_00110 [Pseudomonadota bacterium]